MMNGIIFLCWFNSSHLSSINKCKAISKRTQEDAGEERVTAKSKPMMNLVSRYSVRDPNVLASTASESPGKTKYESQKVPLSSLAMFNDIIWGSEDNERECDANATLVSVFAKRFPPGRWSFLGPGSEKKWYSTFFD